MHFNNRSTLSGAVASNRQPEVLALEKNLDRSVLIFVYKKNVKEVFFLVLPQ